MADTAARLVDDWLPTEGVGYRQWVFSFPKRLRVLLARDNKLMARVFTICMRRVFAYQRKVARKQGRAPSHAGDAQTLGVLFVQRFGSLLTLNPHGHAIVADGVFVQHDDGLAFVALPAPSDEDVEAIALGIVRAILRVLASQSDEPAADADPEAEAVDATLAEAANLQSERLPHVDALADDDDHGDAKRKRKRRTAMVKTDLGIFSVHADTSVAPGDAAALERLVRYAARPGFSQQRLSLSASGKVVYKLRRAYYTGQTEVVLEPVAFLRRLAALIPPPRQNQVRYFGLLASQAKDRNKLRALRCQDDPGDAAPAGGSGAAPPSDEPAEPAAKTYRAAWAVLLKRIFKFDALVCPTCQGPRKIIAAITTRDAIDKILAQLGLPNEVPVFSPARAPPQAELWPDYDY